MLSNDGSKNICENIVFELTVNWNDYSSSRLKLECVDYGYSTMSHLFLSHEN
jgi:hypothetical protein